MIVAPCFDESVIREILSDADIKSRAMNEKSAAIETYVPDFVRNVYLVAEDNGLIGLFVFEPLNEITWSGHLYVLPDKRKEHALDFAHECLSWMWRQGVMKIIVYISANYPKTVNFAKKVGFEVEGLHKGAIWDGGLTDLISMGISPKVV